MGTLSGRVAVVAGATRGAGRGIACMLGEAGAVVYCTGRSVRGAPATPGRPETLEETAAMVTARGGAGIPVRVDHTVEAQVRSLFDRVRIEQGGLDLLVNSIWGGDDLTEFGAPFWKVSLEKGRLMLDRAVFAHIATSRYAAPLMIEHKRGLIVEVTDGDSFIYRGNVFYDLAKTCAIRLAFTMARELRTRNVSVVAVTPGFLRSEAVLDRFGVNENNWREACVRDPHFSESETPYFIGRAVAALAADPGVAQKSGRVFSSWDLSAEYGFSDVDGRRPNWGQYFENTYGKTYRPCDDGFYSYWCGGPIDTIFADWP